MKKNEIYIGIDIGSSTIKAVEIEAGPSGEITLRTANLVANEEGMKKSGRTSLRTARAMELRTFRPPLVWKVLKEFSCNTFHYVL